MSGTILVTGGGRGIGAAIVRQAAALGHTVAFTYTANPTTAEALVAEITASGGKATAFRCDMADDAALEQLFVTLDTDFPPLTAVVNNAGLNAAQNAPLADADLADMRRVLDVNLWGTLMSCRHAIRRMSTRFGGKGGNIVNLSSMAAIYGSPGDQTWYAASKGAISTLTVGLAREVAREGIRVNAVSPGPVGSSTDPAQIDRLARITATVPLGRAGQPAEIAAAVMFLLSDAASFITGAILPASGGR